MRMLTFGLPSVRATGLPLLVIVIWLRWWRVRFFFLARVAWGEVTTRFRFIATICVMSCFDAITVNEIVRSDLWSG